MKPFFILLTVIVSIQAAAHAEKKCGSRYRVAMNSFAPLYWRESSGKAQGLTYDLIEEFTKRTGCTLIQEPMSYPHAATELAQWRVDFYAFSLPMNEWDKYANYDVVYNVARVLVVDRKIWTKKKTIEDYLNDKSVKFADTIGSPLFLKDDERKMLKEQGRLLDLTAPEQGYDLLKTGRVQAMFSSPAINKFFLERLGLQDKVLILRDSKSVVSIGLYSSKRRISTKERARFQRVIKSIRDDGTLKTILSKYLEPEDIRMFYKL